ncbi:hypothetical protein DMH08_25275 [Actinomadura sp. WAC 06369]|nr:hypothetical protein DMH08_25275 [Actinomadura sp. WAC 06369]
MPPADFADGPFMRASASPRPRASFLDCRTATAPMLGSSFVVSRVPPRAARARGPPVRRTISGRWALRASS